jgi:hypothetical protein
MSMAARKKMPRVFAYSPREQAILDLIPRSGEPVTTDVFEKLYNKAETLNPRQNVNATLGTLIRKVNLNKEPFQIIKEARKGPYSVAVWMERRR